MVYEGRVSQHTIITDKCDTLQLQWGLEKNKENRCHIKTKTQFEKNVKFIRYGMKCEEG